MVILPTISKLLIILSAVCILLFSFLCTGVLGYALIHAPAGSIRVVNLIQNNFQECCYTGISQNIDSWKNIIQTIPNKPRDIFMILAIGFALFLGYNWASSRDRRSSIDLNISYLWLYERDNPDRMLYNHLKYILRIGILNSKIYRPV